MTQTMLERAARALADEMKRQAVSLEPKYSGNGIVEPDHFAGRPLVVTVDHTFHLDELARAVLMAVRVPSEAMSQAVRTTEGWEDMIDAILNEPPR